LTNLPTTHPIDLRPQKAEACLCETTIGLPGRPRRLQASRYVRFTSIRAIRSLATNSVPGDADVTLDHAVLHFNRAAHGVNHTAELDDAAVAGALNDAPVMGVDGGIDQIAAASRL
jgi:hypothetical protein